jgi:hypothetical protein
MGSEWLEWGERTPGAQSAAKEKDPPQRLRAITVVLVVAGIGEPLGVLSIVREHVAPIGIEPSQLHDGPHTKAAALQSRPIVDLMRCDVGRVRDPSNY